MSKLEWTQHTGSGRMRARAGRLHLRAGILGGQWWITGNEGGGGDWLASGKADSLGEAQDAAERAALDIALETVAALTSDVSEDEWLSRVIDHDETFGMSVEATSLLAGDRAERLGCALIAAAHAARKETP